ncbi:MAG: exopolysaccharide biosynthesis polyprenyl glycosylphosphotransferase [Rhodospirillales bacterium]|nr:exopolysaccharide biosynthesis polyprenyl glycosylphosphotransferase [Rhodospirillales bacterium]
MFAADIAATQLALLFSVWTRMLLRPMELQAAMKFELALALLLLPVTTALLGLYPGYRITGVERLRRRVISLGIVFAALVIWDRIVQGGDWSRGLLIFVPFYLTLLVPLFSWIVRTGAIAGGMWGAPVLILGAGRTGERVLQILRAERDMGMVPVAFLDDDPRKIGGTVQGLPVLGPTSMAFQLRDELNTVVVALPSSPKLKWLLDGLPFPTVIMVPNLQGLQSLWIAPRDLGGVLALELRRNLQSWRSQFIKRTSDLIMSSLLLLFTLPLLLTCALAVKVASPRGPVFYRQQRIGRDGRPFWILKLRSMVPDADARLMEHLNSNAEAREEWRRYVKLKNDPRLIPLVGKWLRKSSIDELPQLINVLRGDMSLIGPRPFNQNDVPHYAAQFLELRHSVRPGLTGLWQVEARNDASHDIREQLDTYYIRNWSLWLDFWILLRTPRAVISTRGAF